MSDEGPWSLDVDDGTLIVDRRSPINPRLHGGVMNCLDCHTRRVDRVALAISRCCGAGVCAEHAEVLEHHLETVGGFLVIPQRSEHRARKVLCLACHKAEQELVLPQRTRRHRRVPTAHVGT